MAETNNTWVTDLNAYINSTHDNSQQQPQGQTPASKENELQQKTARMYEILGSRRMSTAQLKARLEQLAKNNPKEYSELIDCARVVRDSEQGAAAWFKSAVDVGERNTPNSMARYILSKGKGDNSRNMSYWSDKNAKDTADYGTTIDRSSPEQLVVIMKQIKSLYDREVQVYKGIPDEPQFAAKLAASESYIEQYLGYWNRCAQKINAYQSDPAAYVKFLSAYVNNPIEPMSAQEQAAVKALIEYIKKGYNLTDAKKVLAWSLRVNKNLNPLLKK